MLARLAVAATEKLGETPSRRLLEIAAIPLEQAAPDPDMVDR